MTQWKERHRLIAVQTAVTSKDNAPTTNEPFEEEALGVRQTKNLRPVRVERTTNRLKAECSTTELRARREAHRINGSTEVSRILALGSIESDT